MKNTCILTVFVALAPIAFAQNGSRTRLVSTQSNGVVVHESAGNEGFVATPSQQDRTEIRIIENWTLPECIDALQFISEKTADLGSSAEDQAKRAEYVAQQERIEKRKNDLIAKSY